MGCKLWDQPGPYPNPLHLIDMLTTTLSSIASIPEYCVPPTQRLSGRKSQVLGRYLTPIESHRCKTKVYFLLTLQPQCDQQRGSVHACHSRTGQQRVCHLRMAPCQHRVSDFLVAATRGKPKQSPRPRSDIYHF